MILKCTNSYRRQQKSFKQVTISLSVYISRAFNKMKHETCQCHDTFTSSNTVSHICHQTLGLDMSLDTRIRCVIRIKNQLQSVGENMTNQLEQDNRYMMRELMEQEILELPRQVLQYWDKETIKPQIHNNHQL